MQIDRTSTIKYASVLIVVFLAACSSVPEAPPELIAARSTVEVMKTDEHVLRFEDEAESASAALAASERALSDENMKLARHRAYMASQYAKLVIAQADNVRVRQTIGEADEKRQALQLQAQTNATEQARLRASRATEDAERLSAELAELKTEQTDDGLLFTLTDVLFDSSKAKLNPGASQTLDKLAEYLLSSADSTITIEGFTDSRGSELSNVTLSENRAESVRLALVSRGVDGQRVSAVGKGEAFPVASNNTPAGRQQNRRVEIIVSNTD